MKNFYTFILLTLLVALNTTVLAQPLSVTATGSNPSCFGGNDGSASANVSFGTTPYSYLWSNAATTQSINSLTAGAYSVTVTDAVSSTVTDTYNVVDPSGITITSISTDATCFGNNDGMIDITVSGGVAPYIFSWDDPGFSTTEDITNLTAGSYTVTVTDNNGCSETHSAIVTEPTALTLNVPVTSVTCNGGADGTATANGTGGTPGYTYLWDHGPSTASVGLLPVGSYIVTVTDANGCFTSLSVNILEPAAVLPNINVTSNVLCNGGSDGAMVAGPSGGDGSYSYSWSTLDNTASIGNLVAGSYTVTVTDGNGCVGVESATVTEPVALSGVLSNISEPTCNGLSDGQIQFDITGGGISPYSYNWNNGGTTNLIVGLTSGTYTVTGTDANGCIATSGYSLAEPALLVANAGADATHCEGSTSVLGGGPAATGGITPYVYNWTPAGSLDNSTLANPTSNATVTAAYSLDVTDANGCMANDSVLVTVDALPTANAGADAAVCAGSNVALSGSVTGSTGGAWTTSGSGSFTDANALSTTYIPSGADEAAGTLTLTLSTTGNGSCSSVVDTMLVTIDGPTAIISVSNNTLCFGDTNGDATANVTGGSAPYSYLWDDPLAQTSSTATGFAAGIYTVIVTDNIGCQSNASVTITEPTQMVSNVSAGDESTQGACDGSASIGASGGTTPYVYLWDAGTGNQTSMTAVNLCAGAYAVTLTDANNCSVIDSAIIGSPSAALAVSMSKTDENCSGQMDGTATANASGGETPYSYSWSGGETSQSIGGIGFGNYYVTVTDNLGASVSDSVSIGVITTMSLTVTTTDETTGGACDGTATVTVAGGGTPYNYQWSSGGGGTVETGLCAGAVSVTVTENGGCTTQSGNMVNTDTTSAGNLMVTLTEANPNLCAGNCNAVVQSTVSGGTAPYTYNWSNGMTASFAENVCAGLVSVTVTDNVGATIIESFTVTDPAAMVISVTGVDETSAGACDGSASVDVVANGMSPYSYSWTGMLFTQSVSNLCVGGYEVNVNDANGCQAMDSVFIGTASSLVLNTAVNNVSCFGGTDGTAQVTVSGGTTPYAYAWSSGAIDMTATGLTAGTYLVTVTDALSDVKTSQVVISEPTAISVSITNSTNLTCYQSKNGSATALATGGVSGYSYTWSNGRQGATLTGLIAKTYMVMATDSNGCVSDADTVVLSQPSPLQINSTVVNANCGQSDGSLSINVQGGTTPYTYNWSGGSSSASLTSILSGAYDLTLTDGAGCKKMTKVMVGDNDGPTVTISSVVAANCGGADGEVYITVTGGQNPYAYLWNNGVTNKNLLSAEAGEVSVVVTDNNGCSGAAQTTITSNGTDAPSISGYVTTQNSGFIVTSGTVNILVPNPYGNAYVKVDSTALDQNGYYAFDAVLPIGDYSLYVEPDNSIPAFGNAITTYHGLTHKWGQASIISAVCDSAYEQDLVVIELDSLNGSNTIGGTVVSDGSNRSSGFRAGDPIPGIDVALEQIPGGIIAFTETDENGEYSFPNVPISDSVYTIYVDIPGLEHVESYDIDLSVVNNGDSVNTGYNFQVSDSTIYVDEASSIRNLSYATSSSMMVYPNPFANEAFVTYQLEQKAEVSIAVFNLLGEMVYTQQMGIQSTGNYTMELNNEILNDNNGVFIIRVNIGTDVHTSRLMQMR